MAPVCPVCKNLDPKIIDWTNLYPDPISDRLYPVTYNRHLPAKFPIINIPFYKMIDSALAGCSTCKLMEAAIKAIAMNTYDTPMRYACVWRLYINESIYFCLSNIELGGSGASSVVKRYISNESPTGVMFTTESGIDKARALAELGTARIIDADAMSSHSLQQAKKWFDECFTSHGECLLPSNLSPARLIDVWKDDYLRLYEARGLTRRYSKMRYATLTYCRGEPQLFSINTDTLDAAIKEGIRLEDLPKTFRDAIKVTRSMGLRYLWIDSLCVIQDSEVDRQKELLAMKDIYGNATLNISADWGADENAGLSSSWRSFGAARQISPGIYVRRTLQLPSSGELSHVQGASAHILSTQGSALQERALSLRVLHFAANELAFECDRHMQCECCSVLKPALPRVHRSILTHSTHFDDPDRWSSLVDDYTKLKLRSQRYALNAISGIASRLGVITGKTYFAGLWKQDLPHNLLWMTSLSSRRSFERAEFPSWSWASVHGQITMFRMAYTRPSLGQRSHLPFLTVTGIVCQSQYSFDFSHIRSRILRASGFLVEITIPSRPKTLLATYFVLRLRQELECIRLHNEFELIPIDNALADFDDIDEPIRLVRNTYFLLFITQNGAVLYFLILHKLRIASEDDTLEYYQRVGTFRCTINLNACLPRGGPIAIRQVLLV